MALNLDPPCAENPPICQILPDISATDSRAISDPRQVAILKSLGISGFERGFDGQRTAKSVRLVAVRRKTQFTPFVERNCIYVHRGG